jgi:hypothetical protein
VIDKQAVLIVGRLDYDLKWYQSTLKAAGKGGHARLVVQDTAFTSYREASGRSAGRASASTGLPGAASCWTPRCSCCST